jgi:hypothetical protein
MKSKVKEMEDEAEKLRKIQEGIEEQMQGDPLPSRRVIVSVIAHADSIFRGLALCAPVLRTCKPAQELAHKRMAPSLQALVKRGVRRATLKLMHGRSMLAA